MILYKKYSSTKYSANIPVSMGAQVTGFLPLLERSGDRDSYIFKLIVVLCVCVCMRAYMHACRGCGGREVFIPSLREKVTFAKSVVGDGRGNLSLLGCSGPHQNHFSALILPPTELLGFTPASSDLDPFSLGSPPSSTLLDTILCLLLTHPLPTSPVRGCVCCLTVASVPLCCSASCLSVCINQCALPFQIECIPSLMQKISLCCRRALLRRASLTPFLKLLLSFGLRLTEKAGQLLWPKDQQGPSVERRMVQGHTSCSIALKLLCAQSSLPQPSTLQVCWTSTLTISSLPGGSELKSNTTGNH